MHGTSTPRVIWQNQNDSSCFGEHTSKFNKIDDWSLTWCCRSCETISSILSMKYGIVPPTINHLTDDENIDSIKFYFQQSSKRDECCYE
jgi:3-oxoacyl-[acyl-carrier-protein] synthase II